MLAAGLLFGCEDAVQSAAEPGADAEVPSGLCAFLVCDDGDPCTADTCEPDVGCRHDPAPVPGCGPSCTPVARSVGITHQPTRGFSRAVLTSPGFLYRVTSGRIEMYAAPPDGPLTPVGLARPGIRISEVAWADDRLYVAAGPAGVLVYDVADQRRPHLMGQHVTVGSAHAIRVDDGLAYVAAGEGGLRILDVSDPTAITPIGALDTESFDSLIALDPARGRVALHGGQILRFIDVSDPTHPIERSSIQADSFEPSMRFVQPEGWLYLDAFHGTQIIDLADPTAPASSRVPAGGRLGARRPEGVYKLSTYGRLELLDVQAPDRIETVREWRFGGSPDDFVVFGEPARVALMSIGGMEIRDLEADPDAAPQTTFVGGGGGSGFARIGSRVYVADDDEGLVAVDITDPATPGLVDSPFEAEYTITGLVQGDGYLVLHELNTGLVAFDVSTPAAAVEIGRSPFELGVSASGMDIAGDHLWAGGFRGVQRLRLTPDGLRPDAELAWARGVGGLVALADPDWAAVSVRDAVLIVHRAADGLSIAAELPWRGDHGPIARAGDRIYVAGGPSGLLVADVSDPTAPRVIAHGAGGVVNHVTAHAERVVILTDDDTLWVLEATPDGLGPAHRLHGLTWSRDVELGPDGRTLYLTGLPTVLEVARIECE